jgi:negative regulator of sigma E activity
MARPQFHFHNTTSHSYVTEKRAPTDESVAILKEMEDEARKKITESTTVHNTEFTCKLHKYYDAINDSNQYAVIYTLNGKQSRIDISVDCYKNLTTEQTACFIRDQVAVDIANKMIHTAFMDMKKWEFFKSGATDEHISR